MTATRFTYQRLVDLVDGDQELIARLVDEGVIERRGDDRAVVDVDRVLVARTLWRDLDLDWPGIELVLRLCDELAGARRRIAELEAALGKRG
ncbi:MAG TPA: chaperone modulator CbpM [Kofleriaceae bacterium]|nr:chaperone modulator CbpM [Kofleriaceae bacterium]